MNVFDEHGFRVILDYGHNEAAVGAMVDVVERLKPLGRRIVCVTYPSDRRDEDIREIARRVAGRFDRYICHSDDSPRGRAPTEVPEILKAGLMEFGVPEDAIEVAESEEGSVERGLGLARPNDLLLIFCDAITRTWKQIIYFKPAMKPEPVPPERVVAAGGLRRAGRLPADQRRPRRPHRFDLTAWRDGWQERRGRPRRPAGSR